MHDATTRSSYRRWGKRTLDLLLGSVLALLALPLIALLGVGSAVAFRAWPIFVQPRVGRRGRPFRCLKIRSLPAMAPRAADKHEVAGIETNSYGRFLRTTHLDELPQLLLVPLGTMSLVGPRPAIPELLGLFPERALEARLRIRPGCTGLWQVSEAGSGPIYGSPEYDEFYVRNYSLKLDTQILGRTLPAMLRGPGRGHARRIRERVSFRPAAPAPAARSSRTQEQAVRELT